MTEKIIVLYDYEFHLMLDNDKKITSTSFKIRGKFKDPITEEETKQGHIMTKEIMAGKWDWLINYNDYIRLPEFRINIQLANIEYNGHVRWSGGHLMGGQRETCIHCESVECHWDCMEALEWAADRDMDMQDAKNEELQSNKDYNSACDALESHLLAQAVVGIDVTSSLYKEAYITAMDAISHNL